jgi:uncharacterized membrane protein SpoIIM required for sporulation
VSSYVIRLVVSLPAILLAAAAGWQWGYHAGKREVADRVQAILNRHPPKP